MNKLNEGSVLTDDVTEVDKALPRGLKTFCSHSCINESPTKIILPECTAHVGLPSSNERVASFPLHMYSSTMESPPNASPQEFSLESCSKNIEGPMSLQCTAIVDTNAGNGLVHEGRTIQKTDARSRWKRVTHTVTLINHMAANIRSASTDLLEGSAVDEMLQQQALQVDAGGVGAATFEGAKTVARTRCKGRKGMEGLLVRQGTGFITFFQGFYVAFLKMPIGYFLIGVLLAPVVLGLLFTPLYLLDVDGLTFNGVVPDDATTSPFVSARQCFSGFLNIFLYALSLSTTFGGSPIDSHSPFCLLVANINTLMAQFLFVFLSGAVFARMSQPSYPIRFSKKAIIKTDDLLPVLGLEQQERYKVFEVRLVLTGPSPCELVDVKICLTFRIFVKLPSGFVFCSTQDLVVVRPQVSYLRYGIMVRHIIDINSPIYGHSMESLHEGDASFSLTVMGMERTSMQPVFHLEDYFVCDGDVVWEQDYVDFIHISDKGQRVLDHSQIDLLKPMKGAAGTSQAVSRIKKLSHQKSKGQEGDCVEAELIKDVKQVQHGLASRSWLGHVHSRKLLKSMSTSFTRAEW